MGHLTQHEPTFNQIITNHSLAPEEVKTIKVTETFFGDKFDILYKEDGVLNQLEVMFNPTTQ